MTQDVQCVHDAKAEVGEGPAWSVAEQALYWTDITGFMFHRYDFASGATRSWRVPEEIGSFALCEGGGFVAALRRGFAWLEDDGGQAIGGVAALHAGQSVQAVLADGRALLRVEGLSPSG